MYSYDNSSPTKSAFKTTFHKSPGSNQNMLLKDSPSHNQYYKMATQLPTLSPRSGFTTARDHSTDFVPIANEILTPRTMQNNPSVLTKKPSYDNVLQGLPSLSSFSPRNEYKESIARSNIFAGSMSNLSNGTPVNPTPLSMLKSLQMIPDDELYEQFRPKKPEKKRKKSKNDVKKYLKKVLAKQLGQDEEEESDASEGSTDNTLLNSSSSPIKPMVRMTEPQATNMKYNYPNPNKLYDPYGYQNPMMSSNPNFIQSPRGLQPMQPMQPMQSGLANNGRKIIQVPVRQNHFPNMIQAQPQGYLQHQFSPYGPMRGPFGPMQQSNGGYGMFPPINPMNQYDPMAKLRQEAENRRKQEEEEEAEAEAEAAEVLERKKKQDIKKKRKMHERKAAAKVRLRSYSWVMTYPYLLKKSVKGIVLETKKKTMIEVPKKLNNSFEFYKRYIIDWIGRDIKTLLEENAFNFMFVSSKLLVKRDGKDGSEDIKKKLSKNENHSDKCCDYVVSSMKVILDKLISCTKKFPEGFFKMIAEITEDGGRLPDNYFTFFEISRMQFSHFGALKKIRDWHSKILIGGLVVLRMFLIGIFMKADSLLGIRKDNLQERMLNLGSLFYHVAMDYLKGLAPITKSEVSVEETRVQPVAKLQTCLFERDLKYFHVVVGDEKAKSIEIIDGFYPREFFNFFLKERKKMADQLKSLVAGWVDVVYEHSHAVHLKYSNKTQPEDDDAKKE